MNRVTIAGLAERLGMSKASVSYALNGQPGVSDQTRQKVLALAAELGWYPSSSARALSHARAGTVGIVFSREPELIGSEPYYMTMLAGIESVLGAADVSLLLRMVGFNESRELAVYERWSGERRVDGVLLFDHVENDPRPVLLRRLELPFVLHGTSAPTPGVAATMVDQAADARIIVEHLSALGHRNIAHVSGPLAMLHERARRSAVLDLASAAGMRVATAEADYTADGAGMATAALTATDPRVTAVIYGNDLMAMGGLAALRFAHRAVPDDLSVVSWDDSILCRLGSPGVTALQRDPQEQGRRSAALLLDVIAGHAPTNVGGVPGSLVERASSGPCRAR